MSAGEPFLPYGRQSIEADDIARVAESLQADYLTTGPLVGRFEEAFAASLGARHAVVSNSGTAALHLATFAAGLGPGDVAIVPSVTFLATANAVRYVGAEVVFADIDPESGLLTPAGAEAALARAGTLGRPRAILPVHLNGHSVDMVGIRALAERHRLTVIEDACHAIGGSHPAGNGAMAPVGACAASDFACFSLHPVKTITMGEGGVTTTNDEAAARRMSRFRSHGMVREPGQFEQPGLAFGPDGQANPWYYEMPEPGFNYRATDFACALGLSQLGKLSRFAQRRREMRARYDRLLKPLAPAIRPVRPTAGDAVLHLYAVLIEFDSLGLDRASAMQRLRDEGIGTMVHYLPVHMQPYYRRRYGETVLPGAEAYYRRVLSIPFYPGMSDADIDRVAAALERLVRRAHAA